MAISSYRYIQNEIAIKDYSLGHGTFTDNRDIQRAFNNIHNSLKKDVKLAIAQHNDFFKQLEGIEVIYSFGFSYSDVDLPYVKKIIKSIGNTKNCVWFLNSYDSAKNKVYEDKIRKCGFLGKFDRFTV